MVTASESGFVIYQVPPPGTFHRMCVEESLGGVAIVALFATSPIAAVVPSAARRVLQLYDIKDKQIISEVQFDAAIHNVLLNAKRLVVVLERHIHLFDLNTMASLEQVRTTNPPNKEGIACLTGLSDTGTCYLAFPQSANAETKGDIFIIDAMNNHQIAVFNAHRSTIGQMAFNASGTMIATCSEKGTVVRVFSNPTSHELLYAFRRGMSPATIYHLAFSPGGEILAATSNSGTLHLFECGRRQSSEIRAFRHFATKQTKTICALDPTAQTLTVVNCPVAGQHSGLVSQWAINLEEKAVTLVKETQLTS